MSTQILGRTENNMKGIFYFFYVLENSDEIFESIFSLFISFIVIRTRWLLHQYNQYNVLALLMLMYAMFTYKKTKYKNILWIILYVKVCDDKIRVQLRFQSVP